MLFYIVNLFLLCGVLYLLKGHKNKMLGVAFIWLTALSALRGNGIGADYFTYKMFFEAFSSMGWADALSHFTESGYGLLNKLVGFFTDEYQWLLAVCSILSMIGVVRFIKEYSRYPIISIWLFITMGMYQMTFTVLRQAIAISLVLVAYIFAVNRKPLKFLFLILLASSFHYTALVFLIMYFFISKPVNKLHQLRNIALLVIIVACIPFIRMIVVYFASFTKYGIYSAGETGEGGRLLIVYCMILLYLYFIKRNDHASDIQGYKYLYFFCVITCLIQSLALAVELINRMTLYFSIPMFILLPNTIERFEQRSKGIAGGVLMILSLAYYIFSLAFFENQTTANYTFFFS